MSARPLLPTTLGMVEAIARLKLIPEDLAASHPALRRGLVRCRTCSIEQKVDSAQCFRSGWPSCCGETMRLVTDDA